ncbi:MAG: class I SAM-dependent rRNA methyltransferase [Bacteroidetes bacterium]|nr:class I SAM-dependent rRNA methyltransferase [Bacteroidota bacterium]
MFAKVILKSGKDQSVRRFHPWIFSGAIKKIKGDVKEGDYVEVYDNHDEFLGLGHYQIGSITVRMLSFVPAEPTAEFWKSKIQAAWELRKQLGLAGNPATNVFRLVNAEGDGMPGLVIDYYAGTAVMQMHSIGMYHERELLVQAMTEALGSDLTAVYDKSESTLPFKAETGAVNGYLLGQPENSAVLENGNRFIIDWTQGQKTGFFIDQRENRLLVGQYAKHRKVLNLFGYTGGFSVYAIRGEAELVDTIDSSAGATELAERNVSFNFPDCPNHRAITADAFEYLQHTDNIYDLIILDPPAFAKHRNVLHNALQGYKRLNTLAFEKIAAGGILFTFSCSQAVSREQFRKSVFSAAAATGRQVRILHQLSQPADHPVNIYHPEGEYLKGLALSVDY